MLVAREDEHRGAERIARERIDAARASGAPAEIEVLLDEQEPALEELRTLAHEISEPQPRSRGDRT
jgi:hypothetical protein